MSMLLHERLYRGAEALERLGQARIVLCGAGALGSQLADNLVRQGARRLAIVDMDRVEEHNVGTQIYDLHEVGAYKADVLRARCFRAAGVELEVSTRQLTAGNVAKLLRGADLVLDTFDNSASRQLVTDHCRAAAVPCLHVGLNADYGEARWNDVYQVPRDVALGDACQYPLARNIILVMVALASELVLEYLVSLRKTSLSFTLRDMSVNVERWD